MAGIALTMLIFEIMQANEKEAARRGCAMIGKARDSFVCNLSSALSIADFRSHTIRERTGEQSLIGKRSFPHCVTEPDLSGLANLTREDAGQGIATLCGCEQIRRCLSPTSRFNDSNFSFRVPPFPFPMPGPADDPLAVIFPFQIV
jgi:hypothetical protein